jgi:hypothetical protein
MGIRKIKRIIKIVIKEIIAVLALTVFFLALFYWVAVIINFFVPVT